MSNKKLGQFFTPTFIIELMLNHIQYYGADILSKSICDNSAGDGAFLIEVVKRFIQSAKDNNIENIEEQLNEKIYGIELDKKTYKKLIKNLNKVVENCGLDLTKINWKNIKNDNALNADLKVDLIIENPPYIRKRNMINKKELDNFLFSSQSNGDLYLSFFEKSLNSLNENGELLYITPSSWLNSKSAEKMRECFYNENLIESIIDFAHNQIFNATTYVAITHLKMNKNSQNTHCYSFKDNQFHYLANITLEYIQNKFYLIEKQDKPFLMDILSSNCKNNIKVKNGFATLCDKVFIKENFDFKSNFIIDVVKGSTGKAYKAIFPYKINKEIVERVEEKYLDNAILNYLKQNKEHLLNRSIEKNSKWFEYGRSQGILDIYKNKLSINNLTKDGSLKIVEATGKGVFSGLYILYMKMKKKN